MKNAIRIIRVTAIVLVTACQSTQTRTDATAVNARQSGTARPNLMGRWDFRVVLGERSAPGELWLFERGGAYTGTLTVQGTNALPVRSLVLQHKQVAMIVDTPDGPVTLAGEVDAAGTTIQGIVTYHEGQKYPLEAKRRVAAGS